MKLGDNIIAMGAYNGVGFGGLSPNATVKNMGTRRTLHCVGAACSTGWRNSSGNPRATAAESN